MFKRLWPTNANLSESTRRFAYDITPPNASTAASPGSTVGACNQREQQQQQLHREQQQQHRDDAPMTPVVYVVLWTSVAVGGLRGYAMNSSVSARVAPSYTFIFSGRHQAELLRGESLYCTNGVDGLPGVSWYEGLIAIVPPVLAPLLAAVFVSYYGRKAGISLGCVALMVGQILLASATVLVQLYIGQALVIAASDVLFLSIILQDVEIAARNSRGFFLVVHILGFALGSCAVAVVGFFVSNQTSLGWRLMFAMGTLPTMAVLLVTPWLYETPHSLIGRGRYAQGWEALREIRGPFYDDTYGEFMSIVRAAAAAPKGLMMYVELLRKRCYWPAIMLGMSMSIIAALLDPLSRAYVVYQSLTRSGVSFNNSVLMSLLTLHGAFAVGALIAVVLVDRVGRLPLLRTSSTMAVVVVAALVAVAMNYSAITRHSVDDNRTVPLLWSQLQLATLAVMAAGNGIAWSSAAWVIISESQSLAVRPAAVALCIATTNLAASVVESKLLCLLKLRYYWFVLVVSLIALVIALFFVPETGRVSLEDISSLYAQHWWWGRVLNPKQKRRPRLVAGTPASQLPRHNDKPPPPGPGAGPTVRAVLPTVVPTDVQEVASRADDVAAAADGDGHHHRITPFGNQEQQLRAPSAGADDPKTAEALAAASRIALAGAASAATRSLHSSQALQHGRSSRRLRLGGRKNTQGSQSGAAEAFDQLADELQVED